MDVWARASCNRRTFLKGVGALALCSGCPGPDPDNPRVIEYPNIPEDWDFNLPAADPLLASYTINKLTIPNRLTKTATRERMADWQWRATGTYADWQRTLACGGAGLVITGSIYTQLAGAGLPESCLADGADKVPCLKLAPQAVHDVGGIIFAQLTDVGAETTAQINGGLGARAPSAVPNLNGQVPRVMSAAEIADAIAAFGQAAAIVRDAGFDGIEIQMGHDDLASQFLNPARNKRTDGYGGNLANRQRFALEVLAAVRQAVGPDYPLIAKINGDLGTQAPEDLDEAIQTALALEQGGIDAFDVSCGGPEAISGPHRPPLEAFSEFKENRNVKSAAAIRAAVHRPVIVVGGLREPRTMRLIAHNEGADAIGLARPLIRSPYFAKQILEGSEDRSLCGSPNDCLFGLEQGRLQCWNMCDTCSA